MNSSSDPQKVFNPESGAHRRDGMNYKLTNDEIIQFREQGYLVLDEFMTDVEVSTLDGWFDHFVAGSRKEWDGTSAT